MRALTSSVSDWLGGGRRDSRHSPEARDSAPLSTAPRSSSRT